MGEGRSKSLIMEAEETIKFKFLPHSSQQKSQKSIPTQALQKISAGYNVNAATYLFPVQISLVCLPFYTVPLPMLSSHT